MFESRGVRAVAGGVLATIGTALIVTGMGLVNEGQMIAGGILVGIGAVLLIADKYFGLA